MLCPQPSVLSPHQCSHQSSNSTSLSQRFTELKPYSSKCMKFRAKTNEDFIEPKNNYWHQNDEKVCTKSDFGATLVAAQWRQRCFSRPKCLMLRTDSPAGNQSTLVGVHRAHCPPVRRCSSLTQAFTSVKWLVSQICKSIANLLPLIDLLIDPYFCRLHSCLSQVSVGSDQTQGSDVTHVRHFGAMYGRRDRTQANEPNSDCDYL